MRGKQCFDLRPEIKPIPLSRPVQGADADAIARQQHLALFDIDQHEGKLALQVLKHVLTVILVEMNDDLGIGAGAKHVSLCFELRLLLGIIEELAIADHADLACLVEDRLTTIGDADNSKAAIAHADARRKHESIIVRATMTQSRRHVPDHDIVWLPAAPEIDDACYSAHWLAAFVKEIKARVRLAHEAGRDMSRQWQQERQRAQWRGSHPHGG